MYGELPQVEWFSPRMYSRLDDRPKYINSVNEMPLVIMMLELDPLFFCIRTSFFLFWIKLHVFQQWSRKHLARDGHHEG